MTHTGYISGFESKFLFTTVFTTKGHALKSVTSVIQCVYKVVFGNWFHKCFTIVKSRLIFGASFDVIKGRHTRQYGISKALKMLSC